MESTGCVANRRRLRGKADRAEPIEEHLAVVLAPRSHACAICISYTVVRCAAHGCQERCEQEAPPVRDVSRRHMDEQLTEAKSVAKRSRHEVSWFFTR